MFSGEGDANPPWYLLSALARPLGVAVVIAQIAAVEQLLHVRTTAHQRRRRQAFLLSAQPVVLRKVRMGSIRRSVFRARPMLAEQTERLASVPEVRMDRLALRHVDDRAPPEAPAHCRIQCLLQKVAVFHAHP